MCHASPLAPPHMCGYCCKLRSLLSIHYHTVQAHAQEKTNDKVKRKRICVKKSVRLLLTNYSRSGRFKQKLKTNNANRTSRKGSKSGTNEVPAYSDGSQKSTTTQTHGKHYANPAVKVDPDSVWTNMKQYTESTARRPQAGVDYDSAYDTIWPQFSTLEAGQESLDSSGILSSVQIKQEPLESKSEPDNENDSDYVMEHDNASDSDQTVALEETLDESFDYANVANKNALDVIGDNKLTPLNMQEVHNEEWLPIERGKSKQKQKANMKPAKKNKTKTEPLEKGPYVCHLCGKNFKSSNTYHRHKRNLLKATKLGRKYPCLLCPEELSSACEQRCHRRANHMAGKRFTCAKCSFTAPKAWTVWTHMAKHNANPSYCCHECGKQFFSSEDLRLHAYKHINYECEICSKKFTSRRGYQKHIQFKHSDMPKSLCPYCGVETQRSDALRAHIATMHSTIKPFKCDHCDFAGSLKSRWNDHMREAHPEMCTPLPPDGNFVCRVCQYTTHSMSSLSIHMRRQHDDTLVFLVPSKRKPKPKYDSSLNPFPCPQCDKRFKTQRNVRKHIKSIHCEDKPYKCTYCSYSTKRSDVLKQHIENMHEIGDFPCPYCAQMYRSKHSLRKHVRNKHADQATD